MVILNHNGTSLLDLIGNLFEHNFLNSKWRVRNQKQHIYAVHVGVISLNGVVNVLCAKNGELYPSLKFQKINLETPINQERQNH